MFVIKDKPVFYSLLGTIWRVLMSPVSLTLVAMKFSQEMLGVYYVFFSIAGLQAIAEAGFSHTIIQSISHEMHGVEFKDKKLYGRKEGIRTITEAMRLGFMWFGGISLLCLIIIYPIGFLIIENKIGHYVNFSWATPWFIFIICFALNLLIYPVNLFFEGVLHLEKIYKLRLVIQIMTTCIYVCALFLNAELYVACVGAGVSFILNFLILFIPNFNEFKNFIIKLPSKTYFKNIFKWQMKISMVWCTGYLYWQLPTIILFGILGPVISGQYGMTVNITNAIMNIGQCFVKTKSAIIGKLRADGNLLAAFKLYRKNSNYSYILILVGIAFLFLFWDIMPKFPVFQRMMPPFPSFILIIAFALNQITLNQAMFARCSKEEPFFTLSLFVNFGLPLILLGFIYILPNVWGIVLPFVIMHLIELLWGCKIFKKLFGYYL